MTLNKKKKMIRHAMLLERQKKSVYFCDSSYMAAKIFLKNISLKKENLVGLYWPIRFEMDTRPLLKILFLNKIKVALPSMDHEKIVFKSWGLEDTLDFNRYKFYSPKKNRSTVTPDILVIPSIAIDSKGNRLGYGKGHYDEYFNCHKNLIFVGYCYSFQYFKSLPNESHDLKLNFCVTEKSFKEFLN